MREDAPARAPGWFGVACILAALVFLPLAAEAQVLYGSIVGNVRDQSGAAVPGATITITNRDTNLSREAVANAEGSYTFVNVLPGTYDVKVSLTGFKEYVREAVPVTVGNVARVDVSLDVGALEEVVTVTSQAQLLQTDKGDIHTELKSTEITNLPLSNYRNYQKLLELAPGATPTRFQNAVMDTPSRSLATNVNGVAKNNNNVRQDGTANINVWLPHHAQYVASAETIDTVNIATNSFDAEQGMAGGAAITVITKSGTNQLRGSAFALHDNSNFRARNYFATRDPEGNRNIDGGTLGGPIVRDKLFYFGGYEGQFERVSRIQNATVPTERMRRGDFSETTTTIYNPFTGNPDGTGRQPFANQQIPANLLSPVAQRMLDLIPLPNQPGLTNNYFAQSEQKFDRHQFDLKINWNRSAAHQVWFKYGHMDALVHCDTTFGIGGGPGLCDTGAGDGDTVVKIGTIGHTWTFGSNLIMDGTFGFTDQNQTVTTDDFGQNYGLDLLGIPGTNGPDPRQGGMPAFEIAGFTTLGNSMTWVPIFRDDRSYTANTNFTWLKGQHEMRFGFDLVRHQLNHWQPEIGGGPRGYFVFGGGVASLNGGPAPNTYNALAAFLLGLPTSMRKSLQYELMTGREWQYAFYFRDRWQPTEKLTLSLGLRMERYPLMTRADRGIEAVDLDTLQVLLGGRGGNPEDLNIEVKYPWLLPRLGVAYRLNDETVIRSGFGITVDPLPFSRPLRGFYPLTIAQSFDSATGFVPFASLESGIPAFSGPDLSAGSVPLPNTADMRTPPLGGELDRGTIYSWNVVAERRLPWDVVASVGYVATAVRNQLADLNINAAGPGEGRDGQPFFQRFGRTAALLLWNGRVKANYHSLQTSISRPLLNGLLLKGAYTWSKAMNEADESGWQGLTFNHPSQLHRNYALAGYDRTHVFQLGFVAELPFGRNGNSPLDLLVRDWQVNGIISAYSGTPFTVTAPGASLNAPGNTQTADQVGTLSRTGSVERDPRAGNVTTTFYDPSAFVPVTEARFGNAGRNSVRGPGHKNVDLSVFRSFPFMDKYRLEARMEIFNLFNTPMFNNPVASVDSANFMRITSSQEPFDRQIRFGLRFSF